MTLADRWRAARPPVAGVHLDSAACSRQSHAVIDAAAQHARHEAELGGYVAAEAAAPTLAAGRAAVHALTGLSDVTFTTGAGHALDVLLDDWSGDRTLACLPGEFGNNLETMARRGFQVRHLPVDGDGRLDPDAAAAALAADPPGLVHLTVLGSHRGTVHPVTTLAGACRDLGIPLYVDAAQGFAHLDCADFGADALYTAGRKWTTGPRGVGILATRPGVLSEQCVTRLANAEANVGLHVALSVALGAYVAEGPAAVVARLVEVGARTRTALADVAGWRVVEAVDEPSAITTLAPPEGVDPFEIRARLIAEHQVVTTCAGVARAPGELTAPVLRLSPHVDVTDADLQAAVRALSTLTG